MSKLQDLLSILRALQLITEASVKLHSENFRVVWQNSSLRPLAEDCLKTAKNTQATKPKTLYNVPENIVDGAERIQTVIHGLKEYSVYNLKPELHRDSAAFDRHSTVNKLDVEQRTILPEISKNKLSKPKQSVKLANASYSTFDIKLTESDRELLRKLDMEHRAKLTKAQPHPVPEVDEQDNRPTVSAVPNPKSKQTLSANAKQRKVPSSRIGRMVSFGTLAAGLGLGTATEYAKRTLGLGESSTDGNLFMSKANLDRIVDTLCKVRGAALKLGQIMSIQDDSIINPELSKALERVRKSADFMPNWQVEQVMATELGPHWRENFLEFEERPFAAASIGQVHAAKLKNGDEVAIKIQYPGVAKGIESDIDNLGSIMKMWNVFPKGMFLENLMKVAKRELAWEVDYIREAECTRKFKQILLGYTDYYVPSVIGELSTKEVFTTEMLDGIPVDQCFDMDVEHREFIASKVLELCLREIMEFKYMQTDPNWANFLYNPEKKQILLLDFGASREYSPEFIDKYIQILKGACDGNRDIVLNVSRELGFLTGYESKIMEEAHVDAVMILGEVFRNDGAYNFADQDMTLRIQNLAQTMLTHRLCPPPEEVYSLHRKLSGVFLLCTKLGVSLSCREMFLNLYTRYINEKQGVL